MTITDIFRCYMESCIIISRNVCSFDTEVDLLVRILPLN